jgi:hypothetical protein
VVFTQVETNEIRQTAEVFGQLAKLVKIEPQFLELTQLADTRGELFDLIPIEPELPQVPKCSENIWQVLEPFLGSGEFFEGRELADHLGQRAQLVAGKIELLKLGELADRPWAAYSV